MILFSILFPYKSITFENKEVVLILVVSFVHI